MDRGYKQSQAIGGWTGQGLNRVLWVRHETNNAAGWVSDTSDVIERAVEVVGVAEDYLAFAF